MISVYTHSNPFQTKVETFLLYDHLSIIHEYKIQNIDEYNHSPEPRTINVEFVFIIKLICERNSNLILYSYVNHNALFERKTNKNKNKKALC